MRSRVVALAALLGACAPNYAARLKDVQIENELLTAERDANAAMLAGGEAYEAWLKKPGSGFAIAWAPADFEKAAGAMLPLRLDAKSFHNQLQGTIVIDRVSNVRFAAGNRLLATTHLHGENIRFTGNVPAMFKAEVARFQLGVASGVTVNTELFVALFNRALRARARATSAILKTNSSPNSESMLLEEINNRAMRSAFLLDVALPEAKAPPSQVVVTAGHLVVLYGAGG